MPDKVNETNRLSLEKTPDQATHAVVSGGNIWKPEDNTVKPVRSNYSGYGYNYYGLGSMLAKIFFFTLPIPLVILLTTQMNNLTQTFANFLDK